MTNKEKAIKQYKDNQKREYTVKVTSIIKVIIIVAALGGAFVLGWNTRSDFSNEVRSEVRTQMSVISSSKQ